MKKILTIALAMLLSVYSVNTVMAAERTNKQVENAYEQESIVEVPTLEIVEKNGVYSVKAIDSQGNIIYHKENIKGTTEEITENVYNILFMSKARSSCTHIPCNHTQVWGGITHIISGKTCTMIRQKFYKCAGCGNIIGVVPNSAVIVGTHSAH